MSDLELAGKKPQTKKNVGDGRKFVRKTILSGHQFDATESKIVYFKRAEAQNLRNYTGESNPFDSPDGGLALGLSAEIYSNKFGSLQFSNSTTNVIDAIDRLRNSGIIQVLLGKNVIHEDHLSSLLEPMPIVSKPEFMTNATPPVNAIPVQTLTPPPHLIGRYRGSNWMKKSQQILIPFEPALPVAANENFSVELTNLGGVATTDFAPIIGFILMLKLQAIVFVDSQKSSIVAK